MNKRIPTQKLEDFIEAGKNLDNKIYAIFSGEYSEWKVHGFFETEHEAKAYCALQNSRNITYNYYCLPIRRIECKGLDTIERYLVCEADLEVENDVLRPYDVREVIETSVSVTEVIQAGRNAYFRFCIPINSIPEDMNAEEKQEVENAMMIQYWDEFVEKHSDEIRAMRKFLISHRRERHTGRRFIEGPSGELIECTSLEDW